VPKNLWRENIELLRQSRQPYLIFVVQFLDAWFQLIDGRLLEAVETMARATQLGEEAGIHPLVHMWAGFLNAPLAGYLGTFAETLKELERWEQAGIVYPDPRIRILPGLCRAACRSYENNRWDGDVVYCVPRKAPLGGCF
jgi:hypothetical protein